MTRKNIFAVGASHHTAPLDMLESLSVGKDDAPAILLNLKETFQLEDVVFLSTCNRTEIYGSCTDPIATGVAIKNWIIDYSAKRTQLEDNHLYLFTDQNAVSHLYEVISGLDSLLLGETEIIGQVQRAYELAVEKLTVSPFFVQLFSSAFKTCKRARGETGIDKGTTSTASATVHLAKRIMGNLAKRTVLMVGAGETGKLVCEYLQEHHTALFIANRTLSNAQLLAEHVGGEALPLTDIDRVLGKADIVVCATDAPKPLITYSMVKDAQKKRHGHMQLIVDVSLPHNVEPETGSLPNVFLSNMNDLKEIVSQNIARRADQVPLVKAIINEEMTTFFEHQRTLAVGPLIKQLRHSFEELRREEMNRFASNYREGDLESVDRLTKTLINKLLHWPTIGVRELANESEYSFDKAKWLKRLFGLDKTFEERKNKKQ